MRARLILHGAAGRAVGLDLKVGPERLCAAAWVYLHAISGSDARISAGVLVPSADRWFRITCCLSLLRANGAWRTDWAVQINLNP